MMRQSKLIPGYKPHPGIIWIERNRSTLPNNEWIAADKSGLIASDPIISQLIKKIQAKNIDPALVAITFITDKLI